MAGGHGILGNASRLSAPVVYFCAAKPPDFFCSQIQWAWHLDRAHRWLVGALARKFQRRGWLRQLGMDSSGCCFFYVWCLSWDELWTGFSWDDQPEHLHITVICDSSLPHHGVWILRGSIQMGSVPWEPQGSCMAFSDLTLGVMQCHFLLLHPIGCKQATKAGQDLMRGRLDSISCCKSDNITMQKSMWDSRCGDHLWIYSPLQSVLWSWQCTFLPHANHTRPSPSPSGASHMTLAQSLRPCYLNQFRCSCGSLAVVLPSCSAFPFDGVWPEETSYLLPFPSLAPRICTWQPQ